MTETAKTIKTRMSYRKRAFRGLVVVLVAAVIIYGSTYIFPKLAVRETREFFLSLADADSLEISGTFWENLPPDEQGRIRSDRSKKTVIITDRQYLQALARESANWNFEVNYPLSYGQQVIATRLHGTLTAKSANGERSLKFLASYTVKPGRVYFVDCIGEGMSTYELYEKGKSSGGFIDWSADDVKLGAGLACTWNLEPFWIKMK